MIEFVRSPTRKDLGKVESEYIGVPFAVLSKWLHFYGLIQAMIASFLKEDALDYQKVKVTLKFCHDFYNTLKLEERRKVLTKYSALHICKANIYRLWFVLLLF